MELNHLKYFYYVAKEGGFSSASRRLKIAQPAISATVKKLEATLNTKLFERNGTQVSLTKRGSHLFRRCEMIFAQVDEIVRASKNEPLQPMGDLNIGAAEAIGSHLVPSVLKTYLKAYPNVYPHVTIGTASEILKALAAKKLEFALLFHAPPLEQDLEFRQLLPVGYKLVVATAFKRSESVCSSFIGSREVDDLATKTYPTLKKLQAKYPNASIKISTNSLTAHKQMVEDGLGVSILPTYLVGEGIKSGRLSCLLPKEDFQFNLKVVCRRGEAPSLNAEAFLTRLSSHQLLTTR